MEEIRTGVAGGMPAAGLQGAIRVEQHAFFLDVDGTLLEIARTPDEVVVEREIIELLRALSVRAHGAVAFISGRTIAALDELFHPLMLPAAGLHGFERRSAGGTYHRRPLPPGEVLSLAREALQSLVSRHPALLLEDKRFGLAMHYRQAPHLEGVVLAELLRLARAIEPAFEIQRGSCVLELRPAGSSKGAALAQFMGEAPFRGRRMVCLGDDLTDESAFDWVNARGGVSVAVGVTGRDTAATAHMGSVRAVRMWLRRLVQQD